MFDAAKCNRTKAITIAINTPRRDWHNDLAARMATNGSHDEAQAPDDSEFKTAPAGAITALQKSSENAFDETAAGTASNASAKAHDFTSRILEFLSNASNETLGACIVALGATTWLVLGRVGLVIIGVVGGVVLHATWEGNTQGNATDNIEATEARKRREKGLEIVGRVLDWREKTKEDTDSDEVESSGQKTLDFSDFQPETSAALTALTDAVIRDYVR